MKKGKKGLSTIVITLITILLSLVAIGIVWVVVNNIISEGSNQVGFGQLLINLDITDAFEQEGNIVVDVTRKSGEEELIKIKFVLSDGETSEIIEKESNLGELESDRFFIHPTLLTATEIKTVSVAPVFKLEDGSESTGEITDTYEISNIDEQDDEEEEDTECTNDCSTTGLKQCSGNGYQTCGNYDADSCLEWSSVTLCPTEKICQQGTCTSTYECLYDTDCSSGKICDYGTCATLNYEDVHFNSDDFHRRGIEYIDMTSKVGKMLSIYTTTNGYEVEIILFEGRVNKNEIWWEYDFDSVGAIGVNPSVGTQITKSGTYSITYIPHSKDFNDAVSGKINMKRALVYANPIFQNDYSQDVVVNFNTMPFYLIAQIEDPQVLNNKLNEVKELYKDMFGRETIDLDTEEHWLINTAKIPACGWAGNPIRINPDCWSASEINLGNPGQAVLHEMGHGFGTYESMAWNGYFNELWASFMRAYAYKSGTVVITPSTVAMFEEWANTKEQNYGYNALTYESFDGVDINGALISQFCDFADKYSWDLWKKLFRKYLGDPVATATKEEKMRFFTKSLAESAKEITGNQADYDYIVDVLTDWHFPVP